MKASRADALDRMYSRKELVDVLERDRATAIKWGESRPPINPKMTKKQAITMIIEAEFLRGKKTENESKTVKPRKAASKPIEIIIPMNYWLQWATPGLPEKPFITNILMGQTYAWNRKPTKHLPVSKMIALPKGVKVIDSKYLREVEVEGFAENEVQISIAPFKQKTPEALRYFGVTSNTINRDVLDWYFTDDWDKEEIVLHQIDNGGEDHKTIVKGSKKYFNPTDSNRNPNEKQ